MRKNLLVVSIVLGIVFDVLFWKKTPGISFAIFMIVCLVSGYALLRFQNIRPAGMSWLLLAPLAFCSAMTFNRQEPFTLFICYAFSLLYAAILVMTYRSGQWLRLSLADHLKNLLALLVSLITSGWGLIAEADPASESAKGRKWLSVLRGLLLALPMLIILTSLLSSADLIFAQKLRNLLETLRLQNPAEIFLRAGLILFIAYILAGMFCHAAERSRAEDLGAGKGSMIKPFLGSIEATVMLGSILLLFSIFVLTQFQYFFSGQANISLEGFTYAEYARRGFGELLVVALFSLMILQSLNTITKMDKKAQQSRLTALGVCLMLLVIIILISAFQRLRLYEAAYGFSRLRVYARVFTIWLGILLAGVAGLQACNRRRAFAAVLLLSLTGFTMTISLLNVDAFIARRNIMRAGQGAALDASYLSSLSTDAVPALVEHYSVAVISEPIKKDIGAVLACFSQRALTRTVQSAAWQSFNFSDLRASRALGSMQTELDAYRYDRDSATIRLDERTWDLCGTFYGWD